MLTNVLPGKVTPRFNTKRTPQSGVLLSLDRRPRFAAREQTRPSFAIRGPSSEISVEIARSAVEISPASHAKRRMTSWRGMAAEIVQATSSERTEFRFFAPVHLLVLFERGARRKGETRVDDLRSSLRDVTRKLTFVPASHEYRDWHEPRNPARMVFFYLDPEAIGRDVLIYIALLPVTLAVGGTLIGLVWLFVRLGS